MRDQNGWPRQLKPQRSEAANIRQRRANIRADLGGSILEARWHPKHGSAATYGCEVDLERMIEVRSAGGLYAAHRANLVRFAAWVAGPDDAADVLSEAMLSLLKGDRLVEADNPYGLMQRAVVAKARSMQRSTFRRRGRERRFAEQISVEQPGFRPDVVKAVVELSARQRACVYLTYWEDLTPSMVAERLGIGEGTVKQYLARARARLREVLDE